MSDECKHENSYPFANVILCNDCGYEESVNDFYGRFKELEKQNAELKAKLAKAEKEAKHWESIAIINCLEAETLHDAFLAEQQAAVDALSKLDDTEQELKAQKAKMQRAIEKIEQRIEESAANVWKNNGPTMQNLLVEKNRARKEVLNILREIQGRASEAQGETTTEETQK